MRKPMSLRLRVTLLCAALLTLCCLLLTVTNNFSAIRMADAIQAVPLLPAQRAELEDSVSLPMAELHISDTIQQAQGAFHMQSLLAMVAILALGLFLIYRLVGKALAPLDTLTCRIRERTAADLAQPVEIPDSGDEAAAVALAFNHRQAVCNLVENAVKYSPAGSVVHIAGHRDGEWFQIVVADQGPGIPESLRQRIFEPFFRVDDSRSRQLGGAGLGLALVRAIAEFHGGAVYVEKSRGAGSRFVLKLPCEQDPPPD